MAFLAFFGNIIKSIRHKGLTGMFTSLHFIILSPKGFYISLSALIFVLPCDGVPW